MRTALLKAVLSQEISFFDPDDSTSAIIGRLSVDTVLVQDAISEKVLVDLLLYLRHEGHAINRLYLNSSMECKGLHGSPCRNCEH